MVHKNRCRYKLEKDGGNVKIGIVQKLLVCILVPLILILGIIATILGVWIRGTVTDLTIDSLTSESQASAQEVEAYLKQYFGAVDAMVHSRAIVNMASDQTKQSVTTSTFFSDLMAELGAIQNKYHTNVLNVWYTDLGTKEMIIHNRSLFTSADIDFDAREWCIRCREEKKTIITSSYVDAETNQTIVTIAGPVLVNNNVAGVIGFDVSLDMLNTSLEKIVIGETGYITLLDSANMILCHPDSTVVGTTVEEAQYSSNMESALLNHQDTDGMAYTRRGNPYYGSNVYLEDLGYQVLGVMPKAEFDEHVFSAVRLVIFCFIVCDVILAAIVVVLAFSITRPLKKLNEVAEQLADGELDLQYTAQGRDEVAQLGRSISRIVDRLKTYIQYIDELAAVLDQMGRGDLVFHLQHDYKGEFSKLKDGLLHIQHNMSDVLSSIAQSAIQVNMGADQIASGAQALAQGATEQASSVQELSDAVRELGQKVSTGAEKAGMVITRLNEVKDQVNASNGQMQDMLVAMGDISRHSNDIGKIINTIDNIAFQTNILALNAAVEAARAGTAGKGFAVVADEVRSLAAKSAAAAKETNDLIARSVKAVQQGEEIARSTAEALSTAASSSGEVVSAIEKVTLDYQEQAHHLQDISNGVDQISTVVQTNSATAEESAAASQELAGQAASMQHEIGLFHLLDSGNTPPSTPQSAPQMDDSWSDYTPTDYSEPTISMPVSMDGSKY